jgi:hypothetical protein
MMDGSTTNWERACMVVAIVAFGCTMLFAVVQLMVGVR